MKKMFLMAAFAAGLWACDTGTNDSTTQVATDTSNNTANAPGAYNASEGDVTYREGRVMVWRDNDWVAADDDVTLENGVVVHKDGRVERDGKVVQLEDGEVVDRTGRFFDKAGNAIENAWDETKEGVKKGVNEIKEEAKDITNDRDKENQ